MGVGNFSAIEIYAFSKMPRHDAAHPYRNHGNVKSGSGGGFNPTRRP
jgi:hypothetical protein